jgi:hypothetical protein
MPDHITNRRLVLNALREELVGPAPRGKELDCSGQIVFETVENSYGPWVQKGNGEEVLQRDAPTKRYGIGVLYPVETPVGDDVSDAGSAAIGITSLESEDAQQLENPTTKKYQKDVERITKSFERDITGIDGTGANELDLSASNTYRPSSMGVSFVAEFPSASKVIVKATVGRYKEVEIKIKDSSRPFRRWWLRVPLTLDAEFDAEAICQSQTIRLEQTPPSDSNCGPVNVRFELFARPNPYSDNPRERLITVCMVNRSAYGGGRSANELCLFQCSFEVGIVSDKGNYHILPYPESPTSQIDAEEQSLAMLYRNFQTYAVGHGCAANWGNKGDGSKVAVVSAECLPYFETPSTTPDITDENGNPIRVEMKPLAGLVAGDDGFEQLERVVQLYEKWIARKRTEIVFLPESLQETAELHLANCARCAERMRSGIQYLSETPMALRAFQLANHAILLQQLTMKEIRAASYDDKANRWEFSGNCQEPDPDGIGGSQGNWRAFQIAFLLMALRSTAENGDIDRDTVELIWFPTGGGKTEAYLGLAAFALFMRRLCDPEDVGVHVLTRYTLRLLTAQQFQRTSRLVCAMEYLRQRNERELGHEPFSIGIWVGGSNTPNRRTDAVTNLRSLSKGDRYTENKFVIGSCPWCGAQMGPIKKKQGRRWSTKVIGYVRQADTVVFKCPDDKCNFSSGLPIYVIDEDIYEKRPSIVIGTVDKFATLAWQPSARSIFGIGKDGQRVSSPPGLIIQDELHLIAGPLGSMVGLYETVIEELCTDRGNAEIVKPKIVSSTATIRRYVEQVKALYARESVELFPPSGLDASDSFFARYATDDDGRLSPGRIYVGVHGPGLGSMQTVQVRTFTALMQAAEDIPSQEARDPWWTLLVFFNSLRELGTTLSLFQSDIPDYLKVLALRLGLPYGAMRRLRHIRELTGTPQER